jgi:hypothetical protein
MPNQKPSPLLFVDTNVLLDFYASHQNAGLSLIAKLASLQESIITTCQVEMEFKHNCQRVMADSVEKLKPLNFNLQVPAILAESKASAVITKGIQNVRSRMDRLQVRMDRMIQNPAADPIYKVVQKIFEAESQFNLKRQSADFGLIKRRAFRRHWEGAPPRKANSTSMGDGINWEWILECIRRSNRDVFVVSRDGDYGLIRGRSCFLNDWLATEVQRLSKKRKVRLFSLLSNALKELGTLVTVEERRSEEQIASSSSSSSDFDLIQQLQTVPREAQEDFLEALLSKEVHRLADDSLISDLIATMNTAGCGLDTFGLLDFKFEDGQCVAKIEFSLTGPQNDDQPWCGTTINGSCLAIIDEAGDVEFRNVEAAVDKGHEEPPDAEVPTAE